jgi:hypothetical protein
MSERLYYVNAKDKFALYVGLYSVEPDAAKIPELKSWIDTYGPVTPHFIKRDTPAHYPWADGTGGRLRTWRTWVLTSGRHTQAVSDDWMAWPTTPLKALGALGGRR